tara:strand:+ start:27848 stop:28510 length:663 start_codon:yes stop_codon:yes gene_type:complete
MTYDEVITSGCSYVAWCKNNKNHFGEVLSRHFDSEFVNLGVHGSSNDYSYLRVIKHLNDTSDDDRLLVVFGITQLTRLHEWNNIIDNHDSLWVNNKFNFCQNITELTSEKERKQFLNFYIKYFYNEEFLRNKLEEKLIFLHNYLKKRNGKLVIFNSLDEFIPTKNIFNFLSFNTSDKINNWRSFCIDENELEQGHPNEKSNFDLGVKIINFLGEKNDKMV